MLLQVWGFEAVTDFALALQDWAIEDDSMEVDGVGHRWEFPKIRGTLFWGPYSEDPTIYCAI